MEIINSTSYRDTLGTASLEIGDSKQSSFYPQIKMMHWDNECNCSIRLNQSISGSTFDKSGDTIIWSKGGITARFYQTKGNFEFDITLDSKPPINTIDFSIQSKGLTFIYQDVLTKSEIAFGFNRPNNVIGSYAVYHQSKRNDKYLTGKAFHLYRPFIEDSKGTKVWCDMLISNSILTITVPQDFLDNAVYPITLDPTFGYDTIGGTDLSTTRAFATKCTAPSAPGTTIDIFGYMHGSASSGNMKTAFYDDSSAPVNKLVETASPASYDTSYAWRSCPTSLYYTVNASLWMAFIGSTSIEFKCDSLTGFLKEFGGIAAYPTFENPAVVVTNYDFILTAYASYALDGSKPYIRKGIRPAMFKPGNSR